MVLEHFDLLLGSGLTKLRDNVFRIGHRDEFSDIVLCGIDTGLALAGAGRKNGGVEALIDCLPHGAAVSPSFHHCISLITLNRHGIFE